MPQRNAGALQLQLTELPQELHSRVVSAHSTALRARAPSLLCFAQSPSRRSSATVLRHRRARAAIQFGSTGGAQLLGADSGAAARSPGDGKAESEREASTVRWAPAAVVRLRRVVQLYTVVLFKCEALSLAAAPHLDNTDSQFFDSAFFSKAETAPEDSTRSFHRKTDLLLRNIIVKNSCDFC